MKLIDKAALVADIERRENICKKVVLDLRTEENKDYYQGKAEAYKETLDLLDTIEVKEVDLKLIIGWFDHIAQIANDRMTLTNQRMTDAHALDEIKCLAKNSSEFITKHYKGQKGEIV